MPELAEIIKKHRERKGTQVEVAAELSQTKIAKKKAWSVSSQSLGQYEAGGKRPKATFFSAWKEAYNEDLLAIEEADLTVSDETNVSHETNNITPAMKPGDNNEKTEDPIWAQIEKSEKYTVVPTIILDKYEILSNREIESRETTLQEVRATMKIAIAAKDQVIAILQKEIDGLNEKLKELPHTQQAQ